MLHTSSDHRQDVNSKQSRTAVGRIVTNYFDSDPDTLSRPLELLRDLLLHGPEVVVSRHHIHEVRLQTARRIMTTWDRYHGLEFERGEVEEVRTIASLLQHFLDLLKFTTQSPTGLPSRLYVIAPRKKPYIVQHFKSENGKTDTSYASCVKNYPFVDVSPKRLEVPLIEEVKQYFDSLK